MKYSGYLILELAIDCIEADTLEDAKKKVQKQIIKQYKVKPSCFNLFLNTVQENE